MKYIYIFVAILVASLTFSVHSEPNLHKKALPFFLHPQAIELILQHADPDATVEIEAIVADIKSLKQQMHQQFEQQGFDKTIKRKDKKNFHKNMKALHKKLHLEIKPIVAKNEDLEVALQQLRKTYRGSMKLAHIVSQDNDIMLKILQYATDAEKQKLALIQSKIEEYKKADDVDNNIHKLFRKRLHTIADIIISNEEIRKQLGKYMH